MCVYGTTYIPNESVPPSWRRRPWIVTWVPPLADPDAGPMVEITGPVLGVGVRVGVGGTPVGVRLGVRVGVGGADVGVRVAVGRGPVGVRVGVGGTAVEVCVGVRVAVGAGFVGVGVGLPPGEAGSRTKTLNSGPVGLGAGT